MDESVQETREELNDKGQDHEAPNDKEQEPQEEVNKKGEETHKETNEKEQDSQTSGRHRC